MGNNCACVQGSLAVNPRLLDRSEGRSVRVIDFFRPEDKCDLIASAEKKSSIPTFIHHLTHTGHLCKIEKGIKKEEGDREL